MPQQRQYAVVGPLPSARETRSFLGVEMVDGRPQTSAPLIVAWLPDEAAKDPKLVARLQRETAFVTTLAHPHVERVEGLEAFEEGWARVLDYTDGESLERLLEIAREKGLPVPARVAARIVADASEGLAYAHESGQASMTGRPVVHGAVRLDTIAVTFGGIARVTGFGASPLLWNPPPAHQATRSAFLTPEQVIGGRATTSPATDIYGLGAVLYALLAGRVPFAGEADVESAILASEPAALGLFGAGGELAKVAQTAMAKRGPARFASPAVMRQAIVAAVGEQGLASPAEVAAFVSELVPQGAPERVIRRELLEASAELDALTALVRPTTTPAGVDPALFAASRPPRAPSGIDTIDAPAPIVRAPRPRDETTQIDGTLGRSSRPEPAPSEPVFAALDEAQVAETTDRIARRAAKAARAPVPQAPSASLPSMPEPPAWAKPTGSAWAGSAAQEVSAVTPLPPAPTNGHNAPAPAAAAVPAGWGARPTPASTEPGAWSTRAAPPPPAPSGPAAAPPAPVVSRPAPQPLPPLPSFAQPLPPQPSFAQPPSQPSFAQPPSQPSFAQPPSQPASRSRRASVPRVKASHSRRAMVRRRATASRRAMVRRRAMASRSRRAMVRRRVMVSRSRRIRAIRARSLRG
jgi:serine/threonine protein kinase